MHSGRENVQSWSEMLMSERLFFCSHQRSLAPGVCSYFSFFFFLNHRGVYYYRKRAPILFTEQCRRSLYLSGWLLHIHLTLAMMFFFSTSFTLLDEVIAGQVWISPAAQNTNQIKIHTSLSVRQQLLCRRLSWRAEIWGGNREQWSIIIIKKYIVHINYILLA